jgi:hypothetical protein
MPSILKRLKRIMDTLFNVGFVLRRDWNNRKNAKAHIQAHVNAGGLIKIPLKDGLTCS